MNMYTFFSRCWSRVNARWWGLPLLLPQILMPLSAHLSTRLMMPDGYAYLIYLPIAMMISLLLVFSWAAIPGMVLALLLRYVPIYGPLYASTMVLALQIGLLLCWWGYRAQMGRRWGVSVGSLRHNLVRLCWLAVLSPCLQLALMQLLIAVNLFPASLSVFGSVPLSVRNLINYQASLISALCAVPLYYSLIRIAKTPRYLLVLAHQLRRQFCPRVSLREFGVWLLLICALMGFMIEGRSLTENLLLTDYTLTLLLPLMLWAAMRFGYLFTLLSWSLLLQALYQYRDNILVNPVLPEHMAVVSANMLVLTITLFIMAAVCTHQRQLHAFARRAALTDPIIGLPNLRALIEDLQRQPVSVLCFLRIPELDQLGRTYGLQLRIAYKRGLAAWLKPDLQPEEAVCQLPGFDLVIRLNHEGMQTRIEQIESRLRLYRLSWESLPLHPRIGISYCSVRHPVSGLYALLGELSQVAEMSLQSGRAEGLHLRHSPPLRHDAENKRRLLEEVQAAFTHDRFQLLAQRVEGARGDHFHEILLRLCNEAGEWLKPAEFMPVVHEFGLTWDVDNWVIDRTLACIHRQRASQPGARFSVNVFASTLCRPRFAHELAEKLRRWQVEPWQLMIEVEESQVMSDFSWGNRTLSQLREMGCQVIIDDFGTAFSSYTRLREVQLDMLKIGGPLVEQLQNSSVDFQLVSSIVALARLKHMQVIATHVETPEQQATLNALGVDYIQGYLIDHPRPLCREPE
ncbi:EAL domain-containing protein [Pantoea sp. 1.19]|uniref:sensor domain-containing phosphodiesterase n=1 Tax=Pantoea sp. 1.19 TaxID=1925589 RepID=UPI0009FB5985|nr:EAL domain-containing protein [Pantoea sp. 1.19]